MGVVYNARDERLKRRVAIKVLPPELAFQEGIRTRFLREAETAARLSHPNIVPIHAVGEGPDGIVYFVMAYVDGEPLSARLKRRGRLPAEEVRRILMKHIAEPAPMIMEKRADCPEDLAACVMRCLEKEPESRWPTADALRRALESRSAPPYRPHRTAPARSSAAARWAPEPPALPSTARSREAARRSQRREVAARAQGGAPEIVRRTRHAFVTWASVFSAVAVLDVVNAGRLSWAVIGVPIWGPFGVLPRFWQLWEAGSSRRDILHRPVAPDGAEARLGTSAGRAGRLAPPTADEFGRHRDAINQVRLDRQAILKIM